MSNNTVEHETNAEQRPMDTPRPGRGVLRVCLYVLVGLVAVLVMAVGVVVAMLGPIVEAYVEEHDRELIGRELTMDNLHIKLFSGDVSVENLTLYEADGVEVFASVGNLATEVDVWALLDSHVAIPRVCLSGLSANIVQSPETFNFDSLIDFIAETYSSEEVEEQSDKSSWRIDIENISTEESSLAYYDTALDQYWRLTDVAISTPRLVLEGEPMDIDASMVVNDRARLCGALELSLSTLDFSFDGEIEGFALEDIYKYVVSTVNLESLEGVVTADCSLSGNLSNILAMDIVGSVAGENIAVSGPDGGNIFSAESLNLVLDRLNIDEQVYDFNSVKAKGYATQICFNADGGTNFDMLFYGEPELSVESSNNLVGDDIYDVRERVTVTTSDDVAPMRDMVFTIDTLRLSGGSLRYADNTMHRPFDYALSDISIRSTNFELMGKNQISLRAQLPKQGSAMVVWEGSLADFYNQNILATLSNVDMHGLSTYVEHFTAFPVTSGNMTFRSQNVITNGELSGVNQLDTYNLAVGKKNRSIDVEYDVPMKLGVYVLTDRNKHIDVELPISGNITSPEFSLRKVIWRAIGNLLLKVVASPFEWMAGDKQDAFRHIDIDILTTGLDSEHYARIDTMAMTLKNDTTLRVRLTPKVNYKRAVQRISELNLKMACYNASRERDSTFIDMLDFVRIKDMKLSGSDIRAYADSLLISRGISPVGMTTQAKAKLLYGDLADQQLEQMLGHYNRIVSRYVEFQHKELKDSAFVVKDVTLDDIKDYGGKDRYAVSLIIDGDEVEVASEEEDAAEAEEHDTIFTDAEDAAIVPAESVPSKTEE